jgi:hypothetical protein
MADAHAKATPARDHKRFDNPLAKLLQLGRPLVMGVFNRTPDSFSDGGKFIDPSRALDHAREIIAQGADILDIGAESTRLTAKQSPFPFRKKSGGLRRCCRRPRRSECRSRSTP